MQPYICEFCGNEFNTAQNLVTHKRTAKYCLEERGTYSSMFNCDVCYKTFTSAANLKRHSKICSDTYETKMLKLAERLQETEILLDDAEERNMFMEADIEDLKRKNKALKTENKALKTENAKLEVYKEEYKVIRDKPTVGTVNNNTTNNKLRLVNTATIDPFTVDLVKNRLEGNEYTYGMFLLGENGVKRFILGMITKDDEKNYVTTDITRPNFHRFKETRKWGLDAGAKFLTEVFDEMKPLVREYWAKFNKEANNAKSPEEHESFDVDRDKIKPVMLAIEGSLESKARNELLGNVVRYIKPHVAV